jgi:hypothetical protein
MVESLLMTVAAANGSGSDMTGSQVVFVVQRVPRLMLALFMS